MTDLEAQLRTTLTRVAESDDVPTLPDFRVHLHSPRTAVLRPARRPRRRRILAGVAALAILGGGLTIAAAAGLPVLPASVMRSLGWEPVPGAYNADPSTARLLMTVPGPDGKPLQLWYADASDNGYCVSLSAVVSGASLGSGGFTVTPAELPSNGVGVSGCSGTVGDSYWRAFGGAAVTAANSQSATFIVHTSGATTVRLVFDDGTARVLPISDDWTAGWTTAAENAHHPTLIGYNAAGAEIGRFAIGS